MKTFTPYVPRVIVAQPLYGHIPPDAHGNFVSWFGKGQVTRYLWTEADRLEIIPHDHPQRSDSFPLICGYTDQAHAYVDHARNMICARVLKTYPDVTHIFFSDQDVIYPDETLKLLIETDVEIVSGIYFGKDAEHTPVAFGSLKPPARLETFDRTCVQQVAGIGMGAALVRTSTLRRMRDYFNDEEWFRCGQLGNTYRGEDYHFCERATALGIPIYLDGRVRCNHVGDGQITEEHYLARRNKTGPGLCEARIEAANTPGTFVP